jgi:hypothetical protein
MTGVLRRLMSARQGSGVWSHFMLRKRHNLNFADILPRKRFLLICRLPETALVQDGRQVRAGRFVVKPYRHQRHWLDNP